MLSGSFRSVFCYCIFLIFCFGSVTCQVQAFTTLTSSVYLDDDLKNGDVVTIEGYFKQGATSATYDFLNEHCIWGVKDHTECIDVYHISVRFDEKKIVRATCANSTWSTIDEIIEEFPFNDVKTFVFKIYIRHNYFATEINGEPYPTVPFKYPLSTIRYIDSSGGAIIRSISIQ